LQIAKANSDPLNVIASTQNLEEVLSHFNDTNPTKKIDRAKGFFFTFLIWVKIIYFNKQK